MFTLREVVLLHCCANIVTNMKSSTFKSTGCFLAVPQIFSTKIKSSLLAESFFILVLKITRNSKKNTRLYNPNPKLLRPAELDCLLGALFKGGGEPDFISSSQVSATLYTCDYNLDLAVFSLMIIILIMIPLLHLFITTIIMIFCAHHLISHPPHVVPGSISLHL